MAVFLLKGGSRPLCIPIDVCNQRHRIAPVLCASCVILTQLLQPCQWLGYDIHAFQACHILLIVSPPTLAHIQGAILTGHTSDAAPEQSQLTV